MAEDKVESPFGPGPMSGKEILDRIRNSWFKYIIILIVPGLIFIPVIMTDVCLGTLVLPISAILLLWFLRVEKFLAQLIIGVVVLCVATLLISAVFPVTFTESASGINSADGKLLDGMVTPFRGAPGETYTFTVTVVQNSSSPNITAHVIIYNIFGASQSYRNETMSLVSSSNSSGRYNFSYSSVVADPVNGFGFDVVIDGHWYHGYAAYAVNGPVSADAVAVFSSQISFWIIWIFSYGFMQFIVLLLFLRFSSKSREAREKMLKDYKQMKQEKGSSVRDVKDVQKKSVPVPSEDNFVCSECGADVPSTARFCPSCGEPFDEDEGSDKKA